MSLGKSTLRLGLEHALEDLVLGDRSVGEAQPALHHLLERPGPLDRFVEAGEEPGVLPGHDRLDELVAPAGEVAVDGGPRHLGLAGGVLERGLRQPPAGHAVERGLQDPLADLEHGASRTHRPSRGARPTVSPGRSPTVRTASSTPAMNDRRS